MGAAVRAKMRQAAGTQSLLTIKSKRERAVAALQQAAIALDAASKLAKGRLVIITPNPLGQWIDCTSWVHQAKENQISLKANDSPKL